MFEVARRGPVTDPIRYYAHRTAVEVAVFVLIVAAVFTVLFAPTRRIR